ncbi:MAG: sugar nucleotide-binding protein [Planctomycetia bacterium]|nr:sugar nucleotide-binding protein [Planctomycetia bacterium]
MDRLLVTRTDSLVGANAALVLADRMDVIGLSNPSSQAPLGTNVLDYSSDDPAAIVASVRQERPQMVLHSGPFAASGWDVGGLGAAQLAPRTDTRRETATVKALAEGCREVGAQLVVVITDGLFAGPHMFHNESARPNAGGAFGRGAAAVELAALAAGALVVRSHVYGWSPTSYGVNYAERMFHELTGELSCPVDAVRHATPILATDLAERLFVAHRLGLKGLYHITGAERTSPYRFAAELTAALGVPGRFVQLTSKPERGTRVNVEETSLNTLHFRHATRAPLPMLREGLSRFIAQAFAGFREQLGCKDKAKIVVGRELLSVAA